MTTLAFLPCVLSAQERTYSCERIQEIETVLPQRIGMGIDHCADDLYENDPSCWNDDAYIKKTKKVGRYEIELQDHLMQVSYIPEDLPDEAFRKKEAAFDTRSWQGAFTVEKTKHLYRYHLLISPQKEIVLTTHPDHRFLRLDLPNSQHFELRCPSTGP